MIIETLKKEVIPAIGCTEPVAVALAAAKAKEVLEFNEIKEVVVLVSPNIYKNGLGVGIPNTKEVGLNIACALGIVGGKSQNGLKVLENISESEVEESKRLVKQEKVYVGIKDIEDKVYIEVILKTDSGYSTVIIRHKHDNIEEVKVNGKINLLSKYKKDVVDGNNELFNMKIKDILRIIEDMEYNDLKFLLYGIEMNEKIAERGLSEKLGIGVGYGLFKNMKKGLLADDLINNAMMFTAAGADARMAGVTLPVMSSNGSGNNGLTAILPLVAYKRKFEVSDERLCKALAISHIINCYIKNFIGRLSALCGCGVAAATGASAAISWLMGANYEQIDGAINNMIANISGMICDGAKGSCALKVSTAASVAVQSALLAINDNITFSRNGIIADDVEQTIRNLEKLSKEGMSLADKVIIDIMKNIA